MITTSFIYNNTKRLNNNPSALDVAMECADFLNKVGVNSFKNWPMGELVAGPDIKQYHVRVVFMFPEKLIPDPDMIERLVSLDCLIDLKQDVYKTIASIKTDDTQSPIKKKMVDHKVWLIEILIPERYLPLDGNTLYNIDGENIYYDDLDAIYYNNEQDSESSEDSDDDFDFGSSDDSGGDDEDFDL